jgi:hypothetical protein
MPKENHIQGMASSYSVHFRFSQHFDFPPERAYRWCTDYDSGDIKLQGNQGLRKIRWVDEDTVLLTDVSISSKGTVSRRKLVRLFPERLSWTNTRISSEGRHSQFLYEIVAEKGGSRLDFTGSQIFEGRRPSSVKLEAMAGDLAKEDSAVWRNLARAMAKDLSG